MIFKFDVKTVIEEWRKQPMEIEAATESEALCKLEKMLIESNEIQDGYFELVECNTEFILNED